jgi:NAD(P)-dependent dehydrogenase (short-subunit alcohol dehydrogenase family)
MKTILLTGATDGIGLETARMLLGGGPSSAASRQDAVEAMAAAVAGQLDHLDALINNAGVYNTPEPISADGLDVRFVVNTLAPYLLTQRLLPLLGSTGRVINLSSAAQAPVDPEAMLGRVRLDDGAAYAQCKLAITMWSRSTAHRLGDDGPVIVAVNPGSLLGSKMLKEAFGVPGGDIRIGAEVLCRAALDDEFAGATGQYFDNDSRRFASPHPDAMDERKLDEVMGTIETILADRGATS